MSTKLEIWKTKLSENFNMTGKIRENVKMAQKSGKVASCGLPFSIRGSHGGAELQRHERSELNKDKAEVKPKGSAAQ